MTEPNDTSSRRQPLWPLLREVFGVLLLVVGCSTTFLSLWAINPQAGAALAGVGMVAGGAWLVGRDADDGEA